jgi:hypothetical protein
MNNLILTLLLLVLSPIEGIYRPQIDPIVTAIQVGSSSDLSRFFNATISMNINGQQGDYSKSQGEIVIKDFFKKNPPIEFSIVFKNENPSSVSTYIGKYTSGQHSFKVFIKISQSENSFRIYGLDFVKG